SKDPRDRAASDGAPVLLDVLDEDDQAHWRGLLQALDALGTPYTVDPRLVRGLDYYTRTCFELTAQTGELGSQNALLGGGRYDGMIESLGGPKTPAIGFAMGLERILLALGGLDVARPELCFVAAPGERAAREGVVLARRARRARQLPEEQAPASQQHGRALVPGVRRQRARPWGRPSEGSHGSHTGGGHRWGGGGAALVGVHPMTRPRPIDHLESVSR